MSEARSENRGLLVSCKTSINSHKYAQTSAKKCTNLYNIYAKKCIFAMKLCAKKCIENHGKNCNKATYRVE